VGIQDVVDEINERCSKEVIKVLCIAYEKREGNISRSFPYRIEPKLLDLVIDRLADIIFELSSKNKRKKRPIPIEPLYPMLEMAEKEIKEVYDDIIKGIGLNAPIDKIDKERKKKALEYFDTNKNRFKAIQRKYLENLGDYTLAGGKEWRDFCGKIFLHLAEDYFGEYNFTIGARPLYEKFKKLKNKQQTDQ
jgi:hypothetical protein